MEKIDVESAITLRKFLELVPPGVTATISDLGGLVLPSGSVSWTGPDILLHCENESCGGMRLFKSHSTVYLKAGEPSLQFVKYGCKNCASSAKTFALWFKLAADRETGSVFKYGEVPAFGPPTPARVVSLVGPQKELFLKGRRAENQGLGIAAFAYYRRVVEDQKDRIFDEIIKVCRRLSMDDGVISELMRGKVETQFSKAVESVKHAIPQVLLINGHNPLILLHSALSEGIHAQTDEECLEIATSIRVVLVELASRMGQALKDEAEVTQAVSRLLAKKASKSKPAETEVPDAS